MKYPPGTQDIPISRREASDVCDTEFRRRRTYITSAGRDIQMIISPFADPDGLICSLFVHVILSKPLPTVLSIFKHHPGWFTAISVARPCPWIPTRIQKNSFGEDYTIQEKAKKSELDVCIPSSCYMTV